MITSIAEAKELCVKYDIKLSSYNNVIVTGNNSIYLDTENIDPSDTSEKFIVKGKQEAVENTEEEIIKETKKSKK